MKPDGLFWQFVLTPFLPEHQPALGVSSLLAVLRRDGFTSDVRYLNISFAEEIGWELNSLIENQFPKELLVGELMFARALWGDAAPHWREISPQLTVHCERIDALATVSTSDILNRLQSIYEESPRIVRRWADELLACPPRVIGLSSTFQQNVASLALAKELRRDLSSDELLIVLGGANCEADMGRSISENFPFIDHVVSGESEGLITNIAESVRNPKAQEAVMPRFVTGSPITNLDALPFPDFDSYFTSIAGVSWAASANLVAESSRGCWWGVKSHCTFCGLNGNTMAFRSKRPLRFAEELRALKDRHGSGMFMMADNIMDMKYLTSLLPELTSSGDDLQLFYETKANLRRDQLETMAAAGVVWIQPGIESLSSAILRLMGKGTTSLQNLQLLKWSEELGIRLSWNILTGFPNEPESEYDRVAEFMPDLVHLPAPTGNCRIRMDRFSPYWRSPESHGISNVRRAASYDLAYCGLPESQRERLAYFFQFDYNDRRDPDEYTKKLSGEVLRWQTAYYRKATLEIVSDGRAKYILDSRGSEVLREQVSDTEAAILAALDSHCNIDVLLRRVSTSQVVSTSKDDALKAIARFVDFRWVFKEDDQLLSLVLDRTQRSHVVDRIVSARLNYFGLSDIGNAPRNAGNQETTDQDGSEENKPVSTLVVLRPEI